MILKVTIENWKSFRDAATFTMLTSKERQHGERVSSLSKYPAKVLPIAAIYGGNASGKSNFFKAIHFAKELVVNGTRPDAFIPVQPYRLDDNAGERPSRLAFEILVDETIYEFSFSVTSKMVVEEKLVKIGLTADKVLYHRHDGKPNFHRSLAHNAFLEFAFNGTQDNQLFLTNSVLQKGDQFRPVYLWFKNNLELVAPDSRFNPFELFLEEKSPLYGTMNKLLSALDTGICHLGGDELPFANLPIPDEMKEKIQKELPEGVTHRIRLEPLNERFVVTRSNGELKAHKLVTYHMNQGGDEIKFEMNQESDGSQRVIDLLPAFLEAASLTSKKVYVIDEVDRSLHTLLTRQLIQSYLSGCSPASRSQVLLTTHDVLLMDQDLLRRDEMWVVERDRHGASSLVSFSEYNQDIRYDKDVRKSYLQGRLGGVPRIRPMVSLRTCG
ncbi:MAG: AAA family ATPase [Candidatus Riflebacteria bacterium]|nr:AAA family ATPase [Candidatus Riflebacteria bacterium]